MALHISTFSVWKEWNNETPLGSDIVHAVVPGTFDPVTFGHLDVIVRASRLFSKVTVAVASSQGKNGTGPVFTLDERMDMVREALIQEGVACGPAERVDVAPLTGLLVDFAMRWVQELL